VMDVEGHPKYWLPTSPDLEGDLTPNTCLTWLRVQRIARSERLRLSVYERLLCLRTAELSQEESATRFTSSRHPPQHCGPVGRQAGVAAAKISTALDTCRHGRGALRQTGDSGRYGTAHAAAAMLAERQRRALHADTAEVRDPGRCYADDRW
jgi:hypothetical protein